MPSLTIQHLTEIFATAPDEIKEVKFPTFIESGTCFGATIFPMSQYFTKLHTIELKEEFYKLCVDKYNTHVPKEFQKITFHHGDSSDVLPLILKDTTDNIVFWLDGHWSQLGTARGKKDVPLLEEINAIMNGLKGYGIIIVDDYRLFGTHPKDSPIYYEDWSDITEDAVLAITHMRSLKSLVIKDSLVIFINKL